MSKTKEELNRIKEEVEAVNEKLNELTPEELEQVTGGVEPFNPSSLQSLPCIKYAEPNQIREY